MASSSKAVMVLFYDIAGDTGDHDDWHSHEHFAERLSVPGFLRAVRWVCEGPGPHYLVTYAVSGVDVATSESYLARLNDPTPWTQAMMPRFRGMVRGFAEEVASAGLGLGGLALALRFVPQAGTEEQVTRRLADQLPGLAARRGMAGAQLLRPAPAPPMTREQALRGQDAALPWLLLATGYDGAALEGLADIVRDAGAGEVTEGRYTLHHVAG